MAWEVEFTNEFKTWWEDLSESQQRSITAGVGLLEEQGPTLDYPYTSAINSSRHGNMRELRIQSRGRPLRVFYAFDPRRTAILLIGGDKTGDNRFYTTLVNRADDLYDEHIDELRLEGLL
ncbi:MAG: type II toxin-antitoxin system RelE/ParE family toxin [Chloroflexota bacterium]|nr:type II toxin-antitoxin system RelE/ParE family toxin [Chloroflexota bacterium]